MGLYIKKEQKNMLDFKWKIVGLSEEEAWNVFLEMSKAPDISLESKIHVQEQWKQWCAAQKNWSWGFFMAFLVLSVALVPAFMEKSSIVYAWVSLLWINAMLWIDRQENHKLSKDQVLAKLEWLAPDQKIRIGAMEEGPKKALEILIQYEIHRHKMGWEPATVEINSVWMALLEKNKEK